jgi:hypothetical protein
LKSGDRDVGPKLAQDMTAMKMCFVILLAGCQSQGLSVPSGVGSIAFPIGTYTRCAEGQQNPNGNNFLNGAGFQVSATLTLAQSGDTVTSTYVDQNGIIQSLAFSPTATTQATLAGAGQVIPGFSSLCVQGPGNEGGYPATMTVDAGLVTYHAGEVLLTVTGGLQAQAGPCGNLSQAGASFWVLCEDQQGRPAPVADPVGVTQLTGGRYSCRTQLETFARAGGLDQYIAGGGAGTLTLTANGAEIAGDYSGDKSLSGALRFAATGATTAIAGSGQTMMAPCMLATPAPSSAPEPLPIAFGSLVVVGSTLFVTFAGTTAQGSSCPGAQVAGTLICSR